MKQWKKNIYLVGIIRFCLSFICVIPVITVYWKKHGLDLLDIFWLQAIFSLSVAVFEIPTGYLGDLLGRKKTLMLATALIGIGWFIYSFSTNVYQFIVIEIVLGIGFSLFSGTDTALVYESLHTIKKSSLFTRIEGKQLSLKLFAETSSTFTGGLIAAFIDIKYLLLISTATAVIGFIAALLLHDTTYDIYKHPKGTFYGLYKLARFIFLRSTWVKLAVPLGAALSLGTMLGVWLYQPLWQELKIPIWMFGLLWSLRTLPAMFTSHFAYKIEDMLGRYKTVMIFIAPVLIGYSICAFLPGYFALAGIYFIPLLRGLHPPILRKIIHQETYSDKRATVMSVQNWLFRLSYFALAPLIGFIGNSRGIKFAFTAVLLIAAVLITVSSIPLLRKLAREKI